MKDITATPESSQPPKRSWRRFTLRALFLLVLAAGVFFGWAAYRVRDFKHQARLVESLRAKGYAVETEERSGLAFWRLLVGDSAESDVVRLRLRGYDRSDNRFFGPSRPELFGISKWRSLEELTLFGPSVTDEIMARISTLPKLQVLYLEYAAITDTGLTYLQRARRLRWIYINSSDSMKANRTIKSDHNTTFPLAISDRGIAALAELKPLTSVTLVDVPVGDRGVEALCTHLANLETLALVGTNISDVALAHIARAPAVRSLTVANCSRVTTRGLLELCKMPQLTHLTLRDLNVAAADARFIRSKLSQLDSSSSVLEDVVRADDYQQAREVVESLSGSR